MKLYYYKSIILASLLSLFFVSHVQAEAMVCPQPEEGKKWTSVEFIGGINRNPNTATCHYQNINLQKDEPTSPFTNVEMVNEKIWKRQGIELRWLCTKSIQECTFRTKTPRPSEPSLR